MRSIAKFKEKDIKVDALYMDMTYGGFLAGPSKNRMEEANVGILDNAKGRECVRLFGEDRPTLIIGAERLNLKELLPDVEVLAWLSCLSPVQGEAPSNCFSHLVVIWFQEKLDDPFEKLSALMKDVDWDACAENVDWWSL